MSRPPRSSLIDATKARIYHCYNRTVQGLFLCGVDPFTGDDYSHRKSWIIQRMMYLAHIFLVDLGQYAVLSTHFHIILRNRPDLAKGLTDREVILRWHRLCPGRRRKDGKVPRLTKREIKALLNDPKRIAEMRERLSSVSWYMKTLTEYIARRSNAESKKRGHFFADRFRSVWLMDEEMLIACAVYVDLNELRAELADLPENADFSSVSLRFQALRDRMLDPDFFATGPSEQDASNEARLAGSADESEAAGSADADAFWDEPATDSMDAGRVDDRTGGRPTGSLAETDLAGPSGSDAKTGPAGQADRGADKPMPARRGERKVDDLERYRAVLAERRRRARKLGTARPGDADYWLSPVDETVALPCLGLDGGSVEFKPDVEPGTRLERPGFLPLTIEQYLWLLDWTARQKREGKRGQLPAEVAPILERMGLTPEKWLELTLEFGNWFQYAAGTAERMEEYAKEIGKRWFRGTRHSRNTFDQ